MAKLYGVLDRLRADHAGLRIETCSGGGGRVDLGILTRTDQAWVSDNTDAVDRLVIQHGFGQLHPARTMSAWVTDVPHQLTSRTVPLRFRFHVAMCGLLGIGGDLTRWSEEELAEGAELVAEYKRVRHLVQHGALYRLSGPHGELPTVVQYTAEDGAETLVLAWQRGPRHGVPRPPVRLRGLTPAPATATPAPVRCTMPPCSPRTDSTRTSGPATGPAQPYTWSGWNRTLPDTAGVSRRSRSR